MTPPGILGGVGIQLLNFGKGGLFLVVDLTFWTKMV